MAQSDPGEIYDWLNDLSIHEQELEEKNGAGTVPLIFHLRPSKILRAMLNLKVEWECFLNDAVMLGATEGSKIRPKKIIYAVDDQLVHAYANMSKADKRGFAYPLTNDWNDDPNLQQRGYEYQSRLNMLLKTEDEVGLLLFRPCIEDLYESFVSGDRVSAGDTDPVFETQFKSLKNLEEIDQEIERLKAELEKVRYDSSSISRLSADVTEVNLELEQHLQNHLKELSDHRKKWLRDAYLSFLSNPAVVGPGKEKRVELERANGEKFVLDFGEFVARDLSPKARTLSEELYAQFMDVARMVIKAGGYPRNDVILWRYAEKMGYLYDINKYLADNEVMAEVQFLTTREILREVVRDNPKNQSLLPLRHPKFLARNLDPAVRNDSVGISNKLIIQLEAGFQNLEDKFEIKPHLLSRDSLDEIASQAHSIARKTFQISSSLKTFIYAAELRQSDPAGDKEPANKKGGGEIQLFEVADDNVELNAETLIRDMLASQLRDQTVIVSRVDDFVYGTKEPERAHVMIAPNSYALRYIVKLPEAFISEEINSKLKDSEYNTINENILNIFSVSKNNNKIFNGFEQSILAAARGNWRLSIAVLKDCLIDYPAGKGLSEDDIASIYDNLDWAPDVSLDDIRELMREVIYLRHLGSRASAAAFRNKSHATNQIDGADKDIETLLSHYKDDIRFSLVKIGTRLDRLVMQLDLHTPPPEAEIPDAITDTVGAVMKCLEMEKDLQSNLNEGKATCAGQILYWQFMRARSLQCAYMYLLAIDTGRIPNALSVYAGLIRQGKDFNRKMLVHTYADAWFRTADIVEYFRGTEDKTIFSPFETADDAAETTVSQLKFLESYPTAAFIYYYESLRYLWDEKLGGSETTSEILAGPRDQLLRMMNYCEKLHDMCRRLSTTGFSRRLVRQAKIQTFKYQRSDSVEFLDEVFVALLASIPQDKFDQNEQ